jgi:hypothetical protein
MINPGPASEIELSKPRIFAVQLVDPTTPVHSRNVPKTRHRDPIINPAKE